MRARKGCCAVSFSDGHCIGEVVVKRCLLFSLALIATVVVGCGSEDPVVSVDDSNVEMNKAIETARTTFSSVFEELEVDAQ